MNMDTPMFDKLLETKKDRELCTRFLAFLRKKGYLEADFDKEKEIAEFFEIDLGQAEKERIELVRSFSIAVPIDIFAIQGEIEGMPELNANGVNKKIKAHIF